MKASKKIDLAQKIPANKYSRKFKQSVKDYDKKEIDYPPQEGLSSQKLLNGLKKKKCF